MYVVRVSRVCSKWVSRVDRAWNVSPHCPLRLRLLCTMQHARQELAPSNSRYCGRAVTLLISQISHLRGLLPPPPIHAHGTTTAASNAACCAGALSTRRRRRAPAKAFGVYAQALLFLFLSCPPSSPPRRFSPPSLAPPPLPGLRTFRLLDRLLTPSAHLSAQQPRGPRPRTLTLGPSPSPSPRLAELLDQGLGHVLDLA